MAGTAKVKRGKSDVSSSKVLGGSPRRKSWKVPVSQFSLAHPAPDADEHWTPIAVMDCLRWV